ncbi:MAG: YmdB family metallophosphoesterase [Treponema sp.]|jgi:metallophosphoesterase (TIGR00282 family)|nr:YmdB family metallophosphoesterase [Treponema sp.]
MPVLRVIMIGDVVGEPGLGILEKLLPGLKKKHSADAVIVNGENAAGGFGLSAETLDRILAAGADVVTGGNHVWEKREFWPVLDAVRDPRPVIRPANYPGGTRRPLVPPLPGRGFLPLEINGFPLLVINLQGRELLSSVDCPFDCFDRIFDEQTGPGQAGGPAGPRAVIVDFHAEASEEKEALAYYLDGRASLVAGTHTHVQTADERILPRGTGYITDLGMTGAVNGVIGMDAKICINRARTQVAYRMECAAGGRGNCAVQGIAAEIDGESGKTLSITRIQERL